MNEHLLQEARRILLTEGLWITPNGYRQLLTDVFPVGSQLAITMDEPPTYRQKTHTALIAGLPTLKGTAAEGVTLTDDYSSPDLPDQSVAYHRIFGLITADSSWCFSSKQLERDLLAAEANPQVAAHLLHINSPGGEAWYLDRLSETFGQLQKPVLAIYEMCCSAAYHIGCHAQRLYATTMFDFVGCIGTMVSFWDFEEYFKQLGLRKIEARAEGSDLKNKMFDDLVDGKPEQYVERVLNPLNTQFLATVRSQRDQLSGVSDDAPVLRGETYFTSEAQQIGLCDGQRTFAQAVAECAQMGREWSEAEKLKNRVYDMI